MIGQRWDEDGMRKCEVIFARALSCAFCHPEGHPDGNRFIEEIVEEKKYRDELLNKIEKEAHDYERDFHGCSRCVLTLWLHKNVPLKVVKDLRSLWI